MQTNTLPKGLHRPQLRDQRVLDAIARVPRERFVPEELIDQAPEDRALPIGYEQTISQPFVVALMTQEAKIQPGAKVLEIGTGSGYQAAVLAEMGAKVFSIEIVPELAQAASTRLAELGYTSVHTREGDGAQGWPEQAFFDAILVTAACPKVPETSLRQLKEGGRLIAPIENETGDGERLMLYQRHHDQFRPRELASVRFVPLTGELRVVSEGF